MHQAYFDNFRSFRKYFVACEFGYGTGTCIMEAISYIGPVYLCTGVFVCIRKITFELHGL